MPQGVLLLAVTSPLSVNGLLGPQLPGLVEAGWDVHVISAPGPVDERWLRQVTHHHVPMNRSISPVADVVALVRFARLLQFVRPDVVVGGTPKAGLLSMLAARLTGVPRRIFQIRGARWDGMRGCAGALLVKADWLAAVSATDVLAVSHSLAELVARAGVTSEPPRVLGRGGSKGVDLAVFRPDPTRNRGRNPPTLGFLGRLTPDKGIDDALAVFDAVRLIHPGARLEVIGAVDAAFPATEAVISRLEDEADISWFRHLPPPQVAERMRGWTLLVFPSVREGLPNAVLEAAACGVPTVGYRATGVVDAVAEGISGLLVPLGDRDALTVAALECVGERHATLREGAASWCADSFDARVVQARFMEFLADADSFGRSPISRSVLDRPRLQERKVTP